MKHILRPEHGVKICETCGAALHKNGDWYLAGYKSKAEPPCSVYNVCKDWESNAVKVPFPAEAGAA